MSRKSKGTAALAGVLALSLTVFAVGVSGKSKIRRVGSPTTVENSTMTGKRTLTVSGVVQSSVPKCAKHRSVLLYEDGPGGTFVGEALGHSSTESGADRGEFTIAGVAPKAIKGDRRFRVETVGRKVNVKGKNVICKRGVSVQFPANFG